MLKKLINTQYRVEKWDFSKKSQNLGKSQQKEEKNT
jgi:hypothetical protein